MASSDYSDVTENGRAVDVPMDEFSHRFNMLDNSKGDFSEVKITEKDEENRLLRSMLKTCQNNYKEQELEYTKLIEHIEKMTENSLNKIETDRSSSPESVYEEKEIREAEVKGLEDKLQDAKSRLKVVEKREAEVKTKLELAQEATQDSVLDKIQELKRGNKIAKTKLRTLELDYREVKREKVILEKRVRELEGEKWTVELRARQIEQDQERAKRRKKIGAILRTQSVVEQKVSSTDTFPKSLDKREYVPLTQKLATQPTEDLGSLVSKMNLPKSRSLSGKTISQLSTTTRPGLPIVQTANPRQRCVFCGTSFPTVSSPGPIDTHCHIHHHTFKNGKWGCCSSTYDSAGCLRVPHMRIELCSHNQILLTDGTVRTIALK